MSLTITVISGLYQKIDPKVREARRKKFFGSGRRKRDTEEDEGNLEEDFLLEVLGSTDLEEASRMGRADASPPNSESRFHAFHSCKKYPFSFLGPIIFSGTMRIWDCNETAIRSENSESLLYFSKLHFSWGKFFQDNAEGFGIGNGTAIGSEN